MSIGLTPMNRDWLHDVQTFASDPAVGSTSNVPAPFPVDGAEKWYEFVAAREQTGVSRVFAIEEDGSFRGVIAINCIDTTRAEAQLDYWVAVPFQGRGIATRAIALCAEHARTQLAIAKLRGSCLTRNDASARALQRNGFAETGREVLQSGKFAGQEIRHFARDA